MKKIISLIILSLILTISNVQAFDEINGNKIVLLTSAERKALNDSKQYESVAEQRAEKDCFIDGLSGLKMEIVSYEEFKPLRKCYQHKVEINYGICSYNPCDVNALDLEELKKITFDLNDDNTESDEVWKRLITYFDDRGIK